MSTTATQYKILIGGELVDAASGETMEVIAPGDRARRSPRFRAAAQRTSTARSRRPKAAAPEWLEKTPKERSELLLKLADVIDEQRRGARAARVASTSASR